MTPHINSSIIFFGTSEFAVPVLEALVKSGYQVTAVVTRPDERAGRKQILTPPPVKVAADCHRIPVYQPEKLDPARFAAEIPEADAYVVAAYGKIIPKEILDMPRVGALNIHPSLLPRWRGPSPIQYTILNGDKEAGVSIMAIDELMDHGPILAQRELEISKAAYPELHDRLALLGAELLVETLPRWVAGEIVPMPQDDAKATYSKMLTRDDGRIDWTRPAEELERKIRAFNPWPGAWTLWPAGEKILRVRIEAAEIAGESPDEGGPGYAARAKNNPALILIRAGHGSIAVGRIGVEGKKSLDAAELLRGYPRFIGATLI